MGDRFKYEKPVLIDMTQSSVVGVSECTEGTFQADCTGGSCVSQACCQYGLYTGYCANGTYACGTNALCYTCCETGSFLGGGSSKYGRGKTDYCYCYGGTSAAQDCVEGLRTTWYCDTGSNVECV